MNPPCSASIIIPCYNEREGLRVTLAELGHALAGRQGYEVLVVDDGSTDGSTEGLDTSLWAPTNFRILLHGRNRGYGAALKTGIRHAAGHLLVILDGDGTYPAQEVPRLLDALGEADMVVGARTGRAHAALFRRPLRWTLARYCSFLAQQPIPDVNSGLRAFRRAAVERLWPLLPDGFSFTATLTLGLLMEGAEVRFCPITCRPRRGRSKIRPLQDTLGFLLLVLRTATCLAPLRVFFPVGLALGLGFLASLAYDVFVLANLTDKTLLLMQLALTAIMFALLAEAIRLHRRWHL